MLLPVTLLVVLLKATCSVVESRRMSLTFQSKGLVCDQCSPGTYLRAACTATEKSDCARCPPGSFTELWNHIDKCLRCGTCEHNQEVTTQCAADRNCECQCKEGYFLKKKYGICVRHSECPTGHGVLSKGTSGEDTVCEVCSSGFYSDSVSARHNCSAHTDCDASGQRLVLRGSTWHDNVCATCEELNRQDGADYLRRFLPTFFLHQNMQLKRLRRLALKLMAKDGKEQLRENVMRTQRSDLYEMVNSWVHNAGTHELRQLSEKLRTIGAAVPAAKLERKLARIDAAKTQLCHQHSSTTVSVLSPHS